MNTSIFVIALATVTLASFMLGGMAEQRRLRVAWERNEKTLRGIREEERRNIQQQGYDLRR
jgi:hypothetical protein